MTGYSRRSSPRLSHYDYRQEAHYFVTVCTRDHVCRLGRIREGIMCLSDAGALVAESWLALPEAVPDLHLDAWVVMPNHFHGIVALHAVESERSHDLSALVGRFKAVSARAINHHDGRQGEPVWQRSFYDHVVRNETDLERIREYVANNPARWSDDRFYR